MIDFMKGLLLICFGVAFTVAGMAMMAAGLYLAMAGLSGAALVFVGTGALINIGTNLLVEEYI